MFKTGHGWTAKCRRFPTKIRPSALQCAHPGNMNFNNNFPGARAAAVQFLSETPGFGGPSMTRLQQLDPSGLRVVILKGEVVFRCHDLPLLYS